MFTKTTYGGASAIRKDEEGSTLSQTQNQVMVTTAIPIEMLGSRLVNIQLPNVREEKKDPHITHLTVM